MIPTGMLLQSTKKICFSPAPPAAWDFWGVFSRKSVLGVVSPSLFLSVKTL